MPVPQFFTPSFFTRLTLHTSICVPPFEIHKQPNSTTGLHTIASFLTHSATIARHCSLRHSRSLYTVSDCMCLCLFSHEGPEHNNPKEAVTSTSGPFWQQLLRRMFALVFVVTGIRRFARFGLASFFGYQSVFSVAVSGFGMSTILLYDLLRNSLFLWLDFTLSDRFPLLNLQCYSPRPLDIFKAVTRTHCCRREERLGTRREPSARTWPLAISS